MASIDEQILRTAKEIVVKFIEAGRVSASRPAAQELILAGGLEALTRKKIDA